MPSLTCMNLYIVNPLMNIQIDSCLDYCNSLLNGLSGYLKVIYGPALLNKLQGNVPATKDSSGIYANEK